MSKIHVIKIAYRLKFFGSHGCPSCALTLPLLSLAQNKKLIENIDVEFLDKEEYKTRMDALLANYSLPFWNRKRFGIPKPLIFIQVKQDFPLTLVRPEVTLTVVDKIQEYLQQNGGDLAVLAWLDNEIEIKTFFINLLIELSSNIIFPDKQ